MVLNSEKVRVSPESESINAGLFGYDDTLRKRKEIIDVWGFAGMTSGGRRERNIPSRPYPDFSIDLVCCD